MSLKEIRRTAKVKKQQIGLDLRTIKKIEDGGCNVTVCSLNKYLEAVGLKLTYAIQ